MLSCYSDDSCLQRGRRSRKKCANEEPNKEERSDQRGAGYSEVVKENALFVKFYQVKYE